MRRAGGSQRGGNSIAIADERRAAGVDAVAPEPADSGWLDYYYFG